jgi:cellobiose phosphorylase
MIENTPKLKNSILKAYDILNSKYGIRTCYPHFEKNAFKYVGRVATITPGTYENCCAYVHSTMFAATALFILGEGEKAWEQIEKAIPITHSYITKTPFVMPNSYCYNEEYNLDGQSMGDWYTGSGCVLIRNIVKYAFGIQPDLDGIKINPSKYMPTNSAELKLKIKNCDFELIYENNNSNERKFYVNDIRYTADLDELSNTLHIYLENKHITENITIKIID